MPLLELPMKLHLQIVGHSTDRSLERLLEVHTLLYERLQGEAHKRAVAMISGHVRMPAGRDPEDMDTLDKEVCRSIIYDIGDALEQFLHGSGEIGRKFRERLQHGDLKASRMQVQPREWMNWLPQQWKADRESEWWVKDN
jgi:hypothetical protein